MKTIEIGQKVQDFPVSENVLAEIVLQAKTYDATVPQTDPDEGSNASDDREISILEDQRNNPARVLLERMIQNRSVEEKNALKALCWIGRGDYDSDSWDEAYRVAQERDDTPVADYLSGMPLVGNYLETGAAALSMPLTSAEVEVMTHDQNPDPARSVG